MSFSLAPLLLHSEYVPDVARRALLAAFDAPVDQRKVHLESAARILYGDRVLDLDCRDARELVGLSSAGTCA